MLLKTINPMDAIRDFLKWESASGIILVIVAILAMLLANSPLNAMYEGLLQTPVEVRVGALKIAKGLILWINDGLMAIFFLLIGLEVKREVLEGELSNISQVILPGIAAVGGMVVPALIYVALNWGDSVALSGWAIPAATDIAFALGVLSLLGNRVPNSLKIFLLTLAILDDLAAIVIIAIFYSGDLSTLALISAAITLIVMFAMNQLGVTKITPYVLAGIVLWVCVLKSGVHATLAGVAIAFAIPLKTKNNDGYSPLHTVEHTLHPWVAFGILPIFAFANAGISLKGFSPNTLLQPVPLGILLGLFVGKPLGIFSTSWLTVKTNLAKLPDGANWGQLFGVATLCGIGFTMSLFITSLAFEHGATDYFMADRLGILSASILSAVVGYAILRFSAKN